MSNQANAPAKSENGSGWSGANAEHFSHHHTLESFGKLFKLMMSKPQRF